MPPKGGARPANKIIATNVDNPDDVQSYASLTAAAKAFGLPGHSTVTSAVKSGRIVNGYRLAILQEIDQNKGTNHEVPRTIRGDEFTFFDEVDDLFKGQKVRFTKEQPIQVSVFDIIKVITGYTNPHAAWANVLTRHPSLRLSVNENLLFAGSGERPTPVCNVQTMIELINVLPGERAARFRQAGARVLVRVLGGDESLIDEIRENAGKMEALAAADKDHPMNMFQLPDGLSGVNAICSVFLSPSMVGKTVADFRGPCTYIILFKHGDKAAIKFGWTKSLKTRVREHYKLYPDMKVWFAQDCKFSECAEATEKLFKGKLGAYLQTIQLEKKNGDSRPSTEVLIGINPEKAEEKMIEAYDVVCNEYSVHNPVVTKELEIKQLELQIAKMNAELELARLNAQNDNLRMQLELARLQAS